MPPQSFDDLKSVISCILEQVPYLKLLVLFGSRARGDADENSDWDFAVLYDEELRKHYEKSGLDWLRLWTVLEKVLDLPDNKVDVVDLGHCSPLLAHFVARDGTVLFEEEAGEFERFRQRALKSEAELKAYRHAVREKVRSALQRWKA